MALQGSGQISFADINTELGRTSSLEIGINEAEGGTYGAINQASTSKPDGSTPNAINEWYSYNHSAAFNQFMVVVNNGGNLCGLNNIRTVRTSANDTTLANATTGVTIYRMPQNTILINFTIIADASLNGISYSIDSPERAINSSTGVLGNETGAELC